MKNKLVLLLFLLIPSLCFAESLKVHVIRNLDQKTASVTFVSSKIPRGGYVIDFKLHGDLIFANDNKEELKNLKDFLKIFFPKSYENHFKSSPFSRQSFDALGIVARLRNWAVWDNYAVTFQEVTILGRKSGQELYLYKPDK
jgi:hypothetical protein